MKSQAFRLEKITRRIAGARLVPLSKTVSVQFRMSHHSQHPQLQCWAQAPSGATCVESLCSPLVDHQLVCCMAASSFSKTLLFRKESSTVPTQCPPLSFPFFSPCGTGHCPTGHPWCSSPDYLKSSCCTWAQWRSYKETDGDRGPSSVPGGCPQCSHILLSFSIIVICIHSLYSKSFPHLL